MHARHYNSKYILGIFCYFHDSSACLLHDGKIVAMAEEERFNRKKHCSDFPENAIAYCLEEARIDMSQIDSVSYGFLPWRFFINQIDMFMHNFPKSLNLLRNGASYMPLSKKVIGMASIRKRLYQSFGVEPPKICYIDHHTAHAYSAYYVSPFSDAAVLVADGFGENNATSFYHGKGGEIEFLGSISYPNSLGVYYGTVTQYLGFQPHHDEYKVMGMAAYGEDRYQDFFQKMLSIDGTTSYKLDTNYIDLITHGVKKWFSKKMEEELGVSRYHEDEYEQRHFDIAHSAQARFEEVIIKLGRKLKARTGSKNLCVAGGCAQNVLMNRVLLDHCGFENIFVPPVAYDGGISLGSALAVHHCQFHGKRQFVLESPSWGPSFSNTKCEKLLLGKGLLIEADGDITGRIAQLLADGKVVGYFDGRMEIGPRALGNRSILADPRRHDIKDILNARIKKREFFRPFAPMVAVEDCQTYFDLPVESPFMTITGRVKKPDILPGITHNDGTARIQTVKRETQPNVHAVLKRFGEMTTVPVLLNTSFNENEPIVCTPMEAIDCFLRTQMDVLVFNNQLLVNKKLGKDKKESEQSTK